MRLDSHHFSPAILGKITRAIARSGSFATAAESLADEAEVHVGARHLGRIAQQLGGELREDRDRRVEAFTTRASEVTPEVSVAPRLAAVIVDGGRLQTRGEASGRGPGAHDPAWREDKIANLVTMSTRSHDHDPHPELPRCFTKKRKVVALVQGVAGEGALADVIESAPPEPPPLDLFEPDPERSESESDSESEPDWRPVPLVRTCEATLGSSAAFGPMVAAEARRRNFDTAQARAFLGDGGAWIWTLHRQYFPEFEPIVDFVHVLTYVYLAAKAAGGPPARVWERYLDWATACWQGRVAAVLQELHTLLQAMPPPEGDEPKPTDPSEVIRRSIGYLSENQRRMDYPRYRRAGLPTSTGLIESLVKQFNRRVKGTEKFWNPTQAETMLQLRAAYLSEDDRLAKHLKNRPISAFRRYQTTKRRKAG